jgi:hypothetical protein
VLWIRIGSGFDVFVDRIRIGSRFNDFVDPDLDSESRSGSMSKKNEEKNALFLNF